MHFKHPLVLVALILVVLPIIVHLFQLQKYSKTPFTNVKFLKNIILENRKSSNLKRFLVLLSRILFFTFLILAFSEPYLSRSNGGAQPHIIVFLDNSFSMQAKSKNLNLFSETLQDLIKFPSTNSKITLLTNDAQQKDLSLEHFKANISKLKLSSSAFNLENTLFKIANLSNEYKSSTKAFLISDFQINGVKKNISKLASNIDVTAVKLNHRNTLNVNVDSIYISHKSATKVVLTVIVNNRNFTSKNLAISLYNDNLLLAKSNLSIQKNKPSKVNFTLDNNNSFKGKIVIEDNALKFDNTLFFTINKPKTIRVLSIGKNNNKINKLYSSSEFKLIENRLENLDYTRISKQHLIILNEVNLIPELLIASLKSFVEKGGTLVIIPSQDINFESYKSLFNSLENKVSLKKMSEAHQITKINYNHPLLNNVFEKKVNNFDYPTVTSYFRLNSKNTSNILKLDNNDDFITQLPHNEGAIYFVASPLQNTVNTFVNSPLIVPIFYNIALQGTVTNPLYYTLQKPHKIGINTHLQKDAVLSLKNNTFSFIPQQQIKENSVLISTLENPKKEGYYSVLKDTTVLQVLAFNNNRTESKLNFYNKEDLLNISHSYFTNLNNALKAFKNTISIFELWKICAALALLFLITELLLLKHLK